MLLDDFKNEKVIKVNFYFESHLTLENHIKEGTIRRLKLICDNHKFPYKFTSLPQ